ncbi:MAG: hypothetical protein LBJ81_00195 [Puniceicoccales bacterium]|jgi:hypothetical protein|nr:hypothetical protein [Puniceicoccales bacterium]
MGTVMKKTYILNSVGLLSLFCGTALASNRAASTKNIFSAEYFQYGHSGPVYTPEEIFHLFRMVNKLSLPLDPLSKWNVKNIGKWEKVRKKNRRMRRYLKRFFLRHNMIDLKETAETIQAAFTFKGVPVDDQDAFLDLVEGNSNFENLSSGEKRLIKKVQKKAENWQKKACHKSRESSNRR